MGTFAIGTGMVWSSPMIPHLNGNVDPENNPLEHTITPAQESWIASLNPLGSCVGPFLFGYLSDIIGRKLSLIICIAPVIISYLICSFSKYVELFYVARFINGIGSSGFYTVMPMFIGEISEDSNRGALGCFLTIFAAMGNLFTYTIGPFLTFKTFNLICLIVPGLFLILFTIFVPESPYYYVTKDKKEKAAKSLRLLRMGNEKDVKDELVIIKKNVEESFNNEEKFFDVLKINSQRRALFMTVFLAIVQEFTGIDVILSYLQSIFEATGGKISAENCSIIIGVIQVIVCILASLLIDRLGRRFLLLFSLLLSALSVTSFGVYFRMKDEGYDMSGVDYFPILCLVIFVFAYNIGIGSIPYTLVSELFPQNIKSKAATLTTFSNLIFAFVTTNIFNYMVEGIGMGESFWIFGVCSLIGFIYVFIYVPETKGRSLRDIQEMLINS